MQIDLVTWPSLYMTAYLFLTGTACDFASWLMHTDRSRLASRSPRCLNSHRLWINFELKFQFKHQPALQKCITSILEGAGFYRDTVLQTNLLIINHINLQYHYSEMHRKTFGLNCGSGFFLLCGFHLIFIRATHRPPFSLFFFLQTCAHMQPFFTCHISNLCSVPFATGSSPPWGVCTRKCDCYCMSGQCIHVVYLCKCVCVLDGVSHGVCFCRGFI